MGWSPSSSNPSRTGLFAFRSLGPDSHLRNAGNQHLLE
jgi:hypothetical protein